MDKEQITKILSKIKDTVGENNYKLELAITGHRTGKIKDIIMCSKDGELLLEYVEQLEQQVKKQKEVIDRILSETKETRNILNNNRDNNMLSKSCLLSYLEIVEDLLNEVSE